MGKNVVEKIMADHLVEGAMIPGREIALRIDQTLTQDATGTMAYLQFETMEIPRVKTELSVSYVDHNTLQMGFENADDHRYLQSVAARYGVLFSRPGNGICHQVHLERFGKPGKTLIGSDSHTPTAGGIGMIAVGAGGLDVAVAMGGGPFHLVMPEVIRIDLNGSLPAMVSAKDVILKVLSLLTTKGNVGRVVEYGGSGLTHLSVPERAVITNMGAELGVTTSLFPSDAVTRDFLERQGRGEDWKEILPDTDAVYARVLSIDLSNLKPMVACPHSPDNVKEVAEIEGLPVDQVAIGSCTNSSLKDLLTVAEILKGKTSSPSTDLILSPGSRQVFRMADKLGAVDTLVAAGARIMELACGFCIGNGQSPPSGGVSLRTNNRNFRARSGTDDAQVYLVSPETAAVSALAGRLTDPTRAGIPAPRPSLPEKFLVDDSMVIPPAKDPSAVTIIRGPNIGAPPFATPPRDSCLLRIGIKTGDKTTTDDIMPAGQRLKYRSNIPAYSEFVFEKIKPDFAAICHTAVKRGEEVCIVGRESYGQGSSREHAAICPMHLGVRIVLAHSIERIHRTNLINFGILPLRFADSADYDALQEGDLLSLDGLLASLKSAGRVDLIRQSDGRRVPCLLELSGRDRAILSAGGLLNMLKSRSAGIS